ncbi:RCC1 domain-containing protein [Pseudomonas sp. RL_5y_Pfl2_70]|uniref:RCC1 domain-containing protein n=1 Tax=Pseudomonas sp. RL_5y_Pfl2_70 TaxID=3088712 RepID=UPI0030D7257F
MLKKPAKKIPVLALVEPDIPDKQPELLPSGEWGINLAAAMGVHPEKGLQTHISPWTVMGVGDKAELLLDDNVVDQLTIKDAAEVGQRVTLFVAPRHAQTGSHTLSYRVTRLNQAPETQTPPTKIYVKIEIPGGQDTDPDPGHSELFMYIDPKIVNGVVDKEIAEDGVLIVIRPESGTGLPYPNAAIGDVIIGTWGGVIVESEPLTPEQINDPDNHPIEILIEKEIIEEAGDTDDAGLAVSFITKDKVNNFAEDWCKETRIRVSLGVNLLLAPIVEQATNNVLNLEKLGNEKVIVQVVARSPDFKHGDEIELMMRGTTVDGDLIEAIAPLVEIDNLPHTYELTIQNSDARKLAKTQVSFLYRLKRPGSTEPLRSKGQFVQIEGEADQLAAPIFDDEKDGAIPHDLPRTALRIPHNPIIEVGMAIEVVWFGKRPDGSIYNPGFEEDWYFPDKSEVENPEGFVIFIDGEHIHILNGGNVVASYILLMDKDGEIIKRRSRSAAPINIGKPQFELVKPDVLGHENGGLEPGDLPAGASKLTAPRPTGTPSKSGDKVTYTWDGEVTGKKEDFVDLNALSADKNVHFTLDAAFVAAHIEPNRGKKVTATYRIWRKETDTTSYSNPLTFVVGRAEQPLLDPAEVVQAPDGILDPANAPDGATVRIAANRPENTGDHFYMKWATTDSVTVHTDDKPISGNNKGKPVEFTVDQAIVLACLNKDVVISYKVELFEGGEVPGEDYPLRVETTEFNLPEATFKEATGPQKDQLNPDDVHPHGATVVIPASALLKTDDEITVTVEGQTITTYPHTVLPGQADMELSVIKVPHSVINANEGRSIALSYEIERKAGGTDGPSDPTVYDVRKVIGSGKLLVMGARYNKGIYRESSSSWLISAFNADTLQRVQAEWKYASDTSWTKAETWSDTQPYEPLQVRTSDDQVNLNRVNIFGTGGPGATANDGAFVALRDKSNVVGWGNRSFGAAIPATFQTFTDIARISCSGSSYAVNRTNNFTVAWPGLANQGGEMGNVDPQNFVRLAGNSVAIAGIKSDGSVHAWGTAAKGGTPSAEILALRDAVELAPAGDAFAVLRATGQVMAWGGGAGFGGVVPPEISSLTDIKHVIGNGFAFAAHRENGSVVAWGDPLKGGAVSDEVAGLTNIQALACANAQAFVVMLTTGQIASWGATAYGATIPAEIRSLTDIDSVVASSDAFAALRNSGYVVGWPAANSGGLIPDTIAGRDDLVQLAATAKAFAALCRDGTVVAWGDPALGGDTTPVAAKLVNVTAIYANRHAFTALTRDGEVVTWGAALAGGDSSTAQDRLKGQVSYYANAVTRGLALKASRLAWLNTP